MVEESGCQVRDKQSWDVCEPVSESIPSRGIGGDIDYEEGETDFVRQ